MNISAPAIRHPIGTTLLAIGLMLVGLVAYFALPVASLPSVNFPIITVSASLPGASPETVAATVAAPLERRLGTIPGVENITSTSSLGSTSIRLQFKLSRDIDSAAQDVQSALSAAQADLPGHLPNPPRLRKIDPGSFPILLLALTADTMTRTDLFDVADTVIAPRIAQVKGVSDVQVTGAEKSAIRVDMHPAELANMGLGLDAVRQAIGQANVTQPLGYLEGPLVRYGISVNDGLYTANDFAALQVKTQDGTVVRLHDVADVSTGKLDRLQVGWFDGRPAVLLIIHKTGEANVVKTVERIRQQLPLLHRWIPAGVNFEVFSDRTGTIDASINELQATLLTSIVLVMLVVLMFLRRGVATLAAGVTVPLSLAGTAILMWVVGFSLNNLSLVALTISVGFVVDDAIVMIENIMRNMEQGMRPLRAAFAGAKQIGFTVVSISLSLIAAFSPLVLMGDMAGRLLREFSLTLVFAIAVSAVVSLTVTPMICSRFIHANDNSESANWLDRWLEPFWRRVTAIYTATLARVIRQRALMLSLTGLALVAMAALFMQLPKTFVPQGDSDLLMGFTQGAADASFDRMVQAQTQAREIILADPAVAHIGDTVGSSRRGGNSARMFISLKPANERTASADEVINRLRPQLEAIKDGQVFLRSLSTLPSGRPRSEQGNYQLTLWSSELTLINHWQPKILEKLKSLPELADVGEARQKSGPQLDLAIDRDMAARLGISVLDIDNALNNAFAQRQVSTIYRDTNQYQVVLGFTPDLQRKLADLEQVYVHNKLGQPVPLAAVTEQSLSTAPLSISHENQYPSTDFSYNLAEDISPAAAKAAIEQAIVDMHLPAAIHLTQDDSQPDSAGSQLLLMIGALVAVYLVLGILYESLIHPLTIISTLPSAGFGAMLALFITGTELSLMPVIGVVLLIGIVKKNGIMLVDFALSAERRYGWTPEQAILEAARQRFRPITMTTLAAMGGAVPLLLFTGPGAELREPLGITIIGGLLVSQIMTVYTTPVIYLVLDKFRRR